MSAFYKMLLRNYYYWYCVFYCILYLLYTLYILTWAMLLYSLLCHYISQHACMCHIRLIYLYLPASIHKEVLKKVESKKDKDGSAEIRDTMMGL